MSKRHAPDDAEEPMGTDPPPPQPAAAAAAADLHHDPMAAVPVGGHGGDPAATALLALGEDDEGPPPAPPAAGETQTGEPHEAEGEREREPKRARLAGGEHHSHHTANTSNNHVDPHADAEMASAAAAAAEALADVHHNPHDEPHHHHHQHPPQQHAQHGAPPPPAAAAYPGAPPHNDEGHAPAGYDPAAAAHYQQHQQHQHHQQAYAAHYAHHPQPHPQHHYDYTAAAYAQHQHQHQHEAYHPHHAEAGQYHHQQQGRGQGQDGYVPGGGEPTDAARGAPAKDSDADAATAAATAALPARQSQSQIQATTAAAAANHATRDAKWNAMYDLLRQYRASKGDCLVPGRHPRLGPWVQVQRAQYRLYRENKPSTLTQDKVDRLHALDFAWQIARNRDEAWNDMYAQLVAYAQANGGRTNVPSHSKDQPKLGSWCKRQRKTYRDLRDGRSTTMKPEWVDRLREIGFDLDGPAAAAAAAAGSQGGGAEAAGAAAAAAPANGDDDSDDEGEGGGASKPAATRKATEDDATFHLRLEELKQFVAAEGHGAIPENYPANEVLGRWATQKRKQKRKLDAGKPTRLTAERVQKLEEAGFAWKIWGNRSEKWDEMYQKLVQYKAEYGTVYVVNSARTADPDHRKLGMWCDRQKAAYKLRQQGKNSPMTEERIQRLEDIGFVWQTAANQATPNAPKTPGARTSTAGKKNTGEKKEAVDTWSEHFEELKAYKEAHGDCRVPKAYEENKKLSRWVDKQRYQYNNRQKGKPTKMTDDKLKKLEEIGFDFSAQTPPDQWTVYFNKLVKYRETEGHCRVPYTYPEDPGLGAWVDTCRTQYWRRINGRSSRMTDKRLELLEGIGFVWEIPNEGEIGMDEDPASSSLVTPSYDIAPSRSAARVTWDTRFDELVAYKEANGHCNVPSNYAQNKKLGSFVKKQREDYRKKKSGKKSPMSDTRIQKLEGIGFQWVVSKKTGDQSADSWDQRLEDLRAFKEQHGHCFVPRVYPENQALSYWCERQRQDYRNITRGRPTKMTEERIAILEQAGFQWDGKLSVQRAHGIDVLTTKRSAKSEVVAAETAVADAVPLEDPMNAAGADHADAMDAVPI